MFITIFHEWLINNKFWKRDNIFPWFVSRTIGSRTEYKWRVENKLEFFFGESPQKLHPKFCSKPITGSHTFYYWLTRLIGLIWSLFVFLLTCDLELLSKSLSKPLHYSTMIILFTITCKSCTLKHQSFMDRNYHVNIVEKIQNLTDIYTYRKRLLFTTITTKLTFDLYSPRGERLTLGVCEPPIMNN